MDSYIDSRLERVERALVTLSESIAKYMPQPAQSIELSNADRELSEALHILQTHQNNYLTLSALKAQSDALDAQIRDTLRLLWTTRRDITTTHVTTFPDAATRYNVNWEELLGYARRISKTTLPAPSILMEAAAAAAAASAGLNGEDSAQTTGEAVNTPNTTAALTPAPGGATPSNANGGGGGGGATPAQPQAPPPLGPMDLPPEWNQFLDPLTGVTFVPWPLEGAIRSGTLTSIEDLARQGIDPRGYDPLEEEARRRREEEERRLREENEAKEREEKVRLAREEQVRIARERQRERERAQEEAIRRGSVAGGDGYGGSGVGGISPTVQQPGGKKQFQFMEDDDDDDDD